MDIPDVRYARAGGIAIAYRSVGDGPRVVYAPHLCTIDALWRAPHTREIVAEAAARRLHALKGVPGAWSLYAGRR